MGFLSAYKHLEKLCKDVMGNERGVSAYIEEMERKSLGYRYVSGWESDLKKLKHYRWVRNQIVHDPDYEEEDLTAQEDVWWLEDFYDRIMDRTDPLALFHKATQPKPSQLPRRFVPGSGTAPAKPAPHVTLNPASPRRPGGGAMLLLWAVAVLLLLLI